MSYTNFKIGDKFPLPIKAQGDGGIFQYDTNGAIFILKLSKVDIIAIEAFRTGRFEIGLFCCGGVIFFLYKIDGIFNAWGDCPYHCQFLDAKLRPDLTKPQDKTLNLYLVDSNLDLLLSMRTITMNDQFHNALINAVASQQQTDFDPTGYPRQVQNIWQRHTSDSMAQNAAVTQIAAFDVAPRQPLH